jgi:hypothetical protein
MVGNDVVDLRDGEATPVDAARFDARVFCEAERRALAASTQPSSERWRLWAAKEAAYKATVQHDPATVFSPSRFRVRLADASAEAGTGARSGLVETPAGTLPVRVVERDGAVHAVAGVDPRRARAAMTRVSADAITATNTPGALVRHFATRSLAVALSRDPSELEVRKCGRIPELWIAGRRAGKLSLSHHGSVVGFAWEAPK